MRKHILRFVGQHVECHTYYGTFHGVVVHCTKEHLILAPIHPGGGRIAPPPSIIAAGGTMDPRFGPFGPPAGGPPPGGPGNGPGKPSGWQMAIPLAAILGVTALGMHWW